MEEFKFNLVNLDTILSVREFGDVISKAPSGVKYAISVFEADLDLDEQEIVRKYGIDGFEISDFGNIMILRANVRKRKDGAVPIAYVLLDDSDEIGKYTLEEIAEMHPSHVKIKSKNGWEVLIPSYDDFNTFEALEVYESMAYLYKTYRK